MIEAQAFLDAAQARGLDFFTGVPCSFLTPLINRVISDPATDYVGATSEGEAVAIASGAWLAGRGTVVMCQNSGLGNTVNPLTSLNWPFRIPTLMIVTWRGQPGLKDEPQHELMGAVTGDVLDTIRVERAAFPDTADAIAPALDTAAAAMRRSGLPYALVMAKGSVASETLHEPSLPKRPTGRHDDLTEGGAWPRRMDAIARVAAAAGEDAAIIATTGYCGRELFTLGDRAQNLYQVGSMGCASAMALGVALNVARPVVVLDGDGAALMKMGNLATIGARQPQNLLHVVLDNGVHDSTGGQATVSPGVDLSRVALACGYRYAASADGMAGLDAALAQALREQGPRLIHLRVAPGTIETLGRPTIAPHEVAARFRDFLTAGRQAA